MKADKIIKTLTVFVSVMFLYGCTTYKTLYLQDVEVSAPINQSPVHITDSTDIPSFTFSIRFSYNPEKEIKTKTDGTPLVNSQGFYQVDTTYNSDGTITYTKTPGVNRYPYPGQNLTWNFATVTTGLDLDLKLTRNFAFFSGVNYAGGNNKSLWGGSFGLGVFGINDAIAYRLDAGLQFQSIAYDAFTIAEIKETSLFGSSEEYVLFYHDIAKPAHFDPFVNFTFNTAKREWVANFFINAGYSIQTLLDFEPKTYDYLWYPFPPFIWGETITSDFRGETTAEYFHFTPGVYFNLSEQNRIVIGARFFYETQLNDASSNFFVLPMMQVDFNL
jgi:hypothetical protein